MPLLFTAWYGATTHWTCIFSCIATRTTNLEQRIDWGAVKTWASLLLQSKPLDVIPQLLCTWQRIHRRNEVMQVWTGLHTAVHYCFSEASSIRLWEQGIKTLTVISPVRLNFPGRRKDFHFYWCSISEVNKSPRLHSVFASVNDEGKVSKEHWWNDTDGVKPKG